MTKVDHVVSGSLSALLNDELRAVETARFVDGETDGSGATAMMCQGDRAVVVLAIGDSFIVSFRKHKRRLAHGSTAGVLEVVRSSRNWVDGCTLRELATDNPFVQFTDLDLAFERGDAKEFRWQSVVDEVDAESSRLRELVVLASESPVLRKLYPHLGHRFALSKDEYSDDVLVSVFLTGPDRYTIFGGEGEAPECEGDAHGMVLYLERKLGS